MKTNTVIKTTLYLYDMISYDKRNIMTLLFTLSVRLPMWEDGGS